jgi:peptide/nickel transport system substrate-binding protein
MRTNRGRAALGFLVVVLAGVAFTAVGGANAKSSSIFALPRSETLYTTGTMWGPYSDLNPFKNWDYITGTIGLVYEPLFNYDPLTDKYTPWLASNGGWKNGTTYVATVRSGVNWSDGQPLTAADVVFTMNLLKIPTHPQHTLWTTGLKSVTSAGNKVTFRFGKAPNYQEFNNYLFNVPIVPQHIWKSYSAKDVVSGNVADTKKLVGTGPYTYMSGLNSTQSFTWQKRDGWWATKAYKLDPQPKYIVDIFNGSNNASLANLLAGNIDLSNNFVPGIDKHVGSNIQTYYPGKPYMLSGNTAWLVPNTSKAPLNDPQFRRALAMSINTADIVKDDYSYIVQASNPTGLLPVWKKYVSNAMVKQYGFSYNIAKAKQLLAKAGYKAGSDGYVANKDGSPINLSLVVPNGWSDWMTAIQIIASSAKDAGIKITPSYPDYNTLVDDRDHGNFDLVVNNDQQISNSPWSYYNYMFRLPVTGNQTTTNFERYSNALAWKLTQKLDKTPPTNQAAMKSVMAQLQKIQLQDLPLIPLWYNGVWAQWNTGHWKNWASSSGSGLQNLPAFWRGYFQMGGIQMLSKLKAAAA